VSRGHAIAYRIKSSQSQDKIYRSQICHLYYRQFDRDECALETCLNCEKLNDPERPCQIFRAQYERKKASVQLPRYEAAKETALKKETAEMTEEQMIKLIEPELEKLLNKRGRVDVNLLRQYLKKDHQMHISPYKAYNLKGILETEFKERLGL
jgi:hypothetical protein